MADKEWKQIPGYEGYVVSPEGDIGSVRNGAVKVLSQQKIKGDPKYYPDGRYRAVSLPSNGRFRTVYVHCVVLEVFVGPRPPGCEAEHIDGDGGNNAVSNLRWSKAGTNMTRMSAQVRKPNWDDQL